MFYTQKLILFPGKPYILSLIPGISSGNLASINILFMIRMLVILIAVSFLQGTAFAQDARTSQLSGGVVLNTIGWNGQHLLIGGATDTVQGNWDFLLTRRDTLFQEIATYAYPYSGKDQLRFVKPLANGDMILAGTGYTTLTSDTLEITLMRISAQGNVLWAKRFSTPSAYELLGLAGMDCYADGSAVFSLCLRDLNTEVRFGQMVKLTPLGAISWQSTVSLGKGKASDPIFPQIPRSNVLIQGPDTVWVAWNRVDTTLTANIREIAVYEGVYVNAPDWNIWAYSSATGSPDVFPSVMEIGLTDPVIRKITMLAEGGFGSGYSPVMMIQFSSMFSFEWGHVSSYFGSGKGTLGGGRDYMFSDIFTRFDGYTSSIFRNHLPTGPEDITDFVSVGNKGYAIRRSDDAWPQAQAMKSGLLSFSWLPSVQVCGLADTATFDG
ncbi:MAG: hypothetical protein EAZ89_20260, partial [Bacteroidetes bacterium]